jgi:hypothetical protein
VDADDLIDRELMLNRFRRLVGELARGAMPRTTFQPWEVSILVDIQSCNLESARLQKVLRQYKRSVEHQLEEGPGPPLLLSEFLQLKSTRRPESS